MATRIPPSVWMEQEDAAIWTAIDILDEQGKQRKAARRRGR